MALNAAAYTRVHRLLLERRREIRHPKPAAAVAFGLSAIAAFLQDRIVFGDVTALPVTSDRELIVEAARMLQWFSAYGKQIRVGCAWSALKRRIINGRAIAPQREGPARRR